MLKQALPLPRLATRALFTSGTALLATLRPSLASKLPLPNRQLSRTLQQLPTKRNMATVAVNACMRPGSITQVQAMFEPVTSTCQYIAWDADTKAAAIIDPVLDYEPISGRVSTTAADKLLDFVKEKGLRVERILESHVHADHLTSSAYLKRKLKAMGGHGLDGNSAPLVCIGEKVSVVQETFGDIFKIPVSDMPRDGSQFDHLFKDGESFKLGKLDCKVMFTPGHTPACSTVLIGPDAAFCGDTIFLPDVGSARVDFPKGSAEALFKSIKETIFGLSENVRIFVGHDYAPSNPETKQPTRDPGFCATVEEEKTRNLHINANTDFESFKKWREGRDKTLGRPRLLYQSLQVNLVAGNFPKRRLEGKGELTALIQPVEFPKGFDSQ